MKKVAVALCLLALVSIAAFAQATDSLDWFPSKTGDLWEYLVVGGGTIDTFRITNLWDSIGSDGRIHLRQYSRYINPFRDAYYRECIIDTAHAEVLEPYVTGDPSETTYVARYRFNVNQGDKWVMYAHSVGGYDMARVSRIYDGSLFNRSTKFMQMQFYGARDSTDTVGLMSSAPTLARGFGLVINGGGEVFDTYYLRGAAIDGVLYGDTTRIVTLVGVYASYGFPKSFELYRNYPNPFNPSTTISYAVPRSTNISVKIFNTLGQKVAVLVNEQKAAGYYQVHWNASNVPSGIYFYRLQAGEFVETKKMVLIR